MKFITQRQAAKVLGVTPAAIYFRVKQGTIPTKQSPSGILVQPVKAKRGHPLTKVQAKTMVLASPMSGPSKDAWRTTLEGKLKELLASATAIENTLAVLR